MEESSPEQSPCCGGGGLRQLAVLDSEIAARAGIPIAIKNNQYGSERELLVDLVKLGLDDLHILLNHDGFPIWREKPGDPHFGAVSKIIDCFDQWKNDRLVKGRVNPKVLVNDSFNKPRNAKRCPDFAIFGPNRLDEDGIRSMNGVYMTPHVIIQFSWTNTLAYEKCAVDDMMNYAGVGEYIHLGRPIVAYLIQPLHRGTESYVYGFDVFEVEQDQRTPAEPTMRYRCAVGGVQEEDTVISITPASMGLVGNEGEPFTIAISHIRATLERLNVTFIPALGHEM